MDLVPFHCVFIDQGHITAKRRQVTTQKEFVATRNKHFLVCTTRNPRNYSPGTVNIDERGEGSSYSRTPRDGTVSCYKVAYATPIEVNRTHQLFVAKAEVLAQDQHRIVRYTKSQVLYCTQPR